MLPAREDSKCKGPKLGVGNGTKWAVSEMKKTAGGETGGQEGPNLAMALLLL